MLKWILIAAMGAAPAMAQVPPPAPAPQAPETAEPPPAANAPSGISRIEAVKENAGDEPPPETPASAAAARSEGEEFPPGVKREFIKGELTNLGSDKLVVRDSRFGLGIGYAHLDNSSYLALSPEIDMHFGDNLALGLGAPLNVRAYADGFWDTGKIKLRGHDYDNPSDYARILRFLTVGKKEDQFYLNVSQLFAASIGHGAIVRRYSGNVDTNITRVGAQVDAYGKYGGFEAFVGDVVQPQHFVAALAFVKPLGWLTGPDRDTWGWTSIGLSTAVDFQAPYQLCRNGSTRYPQSGDSDLPASSFGCAGADYYEPGEPIAQQTRRAPVVGVDAETKVLKTDNADLKPFVDYSRLLGVANPIAGSSGSGGGGLTLGMLGRFHFGDVKAHAFRRCVA